MDEKIKKVLEQLGKSYAVTWEEVEKKFTACMEDLKLFGGEGLEMRAVGAVQQWLKKLRSSPAADFEIVVLGTSGTTDYGAQAQYNDAVQKFKDNPAKAIDSGVCNKDGHPLYTKPAFKAKQKIIPAEARERTILFGARKLDKEGKPEHEEYRVSVLSLRGDLLELEAPIKSKGFLRSAIVGTKKSTDILYTLYADDQTKIEAGESMDHKAYLEFVAGLKGLDIKKLGKLRTYMEEVQKSKVTRILMTKGNVVKINKTAEGIKSNLLEICSPLEVDVEGNLVDDPEARNLTIWANKRINADYKESTQDMIVIGYLRKNKDDGTLSVDAFNVSAHENFIRPPDAKPVEPVPSADNELAIASEDLEKTPELPKDPAPTAPPVPAAPAPQ